MALFDSFLSEVRKTLGGAPSSADIGRFQQGAIAGGKRVLGLAPVTDPIAAEPLTEDLMSIAPEDLMSVSPELPVTTPASIEEPGVASILALPKRSSRARKNGSELVMEPYNVRAESGSENSTASPLVATNGVTQGKDAIADLLSGRRSKYEKERADALAGAKDAEKLTDEEKIAYALLGALPGLVGLIGGAAAGGGLGAAAGAAGGLQGGAQGMQMIAGAKQDKRKELLAQAEKAGDRAARVDDQELQRAEQLANQAFTAGESEKGRAFSAAQAGKEMDFRAGQSKAEIEARAKEGAANRANALQLKRMDIYGDLETAGIAAAAKAKAEGSDAKDYEINSARWATRMLGAAPAIDEAQKALGTIGGRLATKSDWVKAMSDPKLKRAASAIAAFLSGVLRKDSGAAITDQEWEDACRIYMPAPNDDANTLTYKKELRDREVATMIEGSGKAKGIIRSALEQVPIGGRTQSSPEDAEALAWANAHPNDPRAAQIKAHLGVK